MKVSKAMEQVWRWKEEVYQDVKDMDQTQRLEYYRKAAEEMEARMGKKLPRPPARREED